MSHDVVVHVPTSELVIRHLSQDSETIGPEGRDAAGARGVPHIDESSDVRPVGREVLSSVHAVVQTSYQAHGQTDRHAYVCKSPRLPVCARRHGSTETCMHLQRWQEAERDNRERSDVDTGGGKHLVSTADPLPRIYRGRHTEINRRSLERLFRCTDSWSPRCVQEEREKKFCQCADLDGSACRVHLLENRQWSRRAGVTRENSTGRSRGAEKKNDRTCSSDVWRKEEGERPFLIYAYALYVCVCIPTYIEPRRALGEWGKNMLFSH